MFRGFSKVFTFTFVQHIKSKGYKTLTTVIGVLCLVLPALIMGLVAYMGTEEGETEYQPNQIREVFVADLSGGDAVDFNLLNTVGEEGFTDIVYHPCPDVETAVREAEGRSHGLLLVVRKAQDTYEMNILLPDDTELTEEDAYSYDSFISSYFSLLLVQKSGLDHAQLTELMTPSETEVITGDTTEPEEEDVYETARMIFGMILPYMTIMVLYFMILFYGQGVANSVIMEKTSKLMDMFLVTVKPEAMILGKVLAIALAGIVQLFCWVVCLVGGFWAGTVVVKAIDPQTQMGMIQLFDSFGELSGMFSASGIFLCILVLLAGFLMYCALAAVGGSLAGKPEDLSSTNVLFTMALVISFLCTLYSGVLSEEMGTPGTAGWQYYVPFTAMLIVPSQVLLGNITPLQTAVSFGIIAAATLIIVALAGKVYSMMVLYKGNPPSIKKMIEMLRNKES